MIRRSTVQSCFPTLPSNCQTSCKGLPSRFWTKLLCCFLGKPLFNTTPWIKKYRFVGDRQGPWHQQLGPGSFRQMLFQWSVCFLRILCRIAYDLHCGCLCCCLVIVSPGVGDELRKRLQLWSQMGKGGRGTRTRKEGNENLNVWRQQEQSPSDWANSPTSWELFD